MLEQPEIVILAIMSEIARKLQHWESFYGREVERVDRNAVEEEAKADEILKDALTDDVAFLVVGDPLGATTHTDLILRAIRKNVAYSVIHNASILNAVGCCGLQLYSFGETVSIVMWADDWQPDSYFERIEANAMRGLHTLCLLDIKMKEQTIENLMRNRRVYEPPRFLTASQAASQLITTIERRREAGQTLVVKKDSCCVAVARVGSSLQKIVSTTLEEMCEVDMGPPLHSLVVVGCGRLHPMEEEMLTYLNKIHHTIV